MIILSSGWTLVPTNTVAEVALYVVAIYMLAQQVHVFIATFGTMRRVPYWKRNLPRAFRQWAVALGLLITYLVVAGWAGWLQFIPN